MLPKRKGSATVVTLAGRRTDAVDTEKIRFPLYNIDRVKKNLHDLFVEKKADRLVCSAACGADLVALDVAIGLKIECHVIIPFSISDFRRISVTDLPGDWGHLYDRLIFKISKQGFLKILKFDIKDDLAFSKTNKALISEAKLLTTSDYDTIAVVVWEGKSESKIDATREFLKLAQDAGIETISIASN